MIISREKKNEEETAIKLMRYVNGVMEWSEKENASMGYLKFRNNKRIEPINFKKRGPGWFIHHNYEHASNSIQTFQIKLTNTKKGPTNWFINYKYNNLKIWVTKYSYKQLYTPRERIACFIVLNLNMHWSTTFLQYHRCRIVKCISSPSGCRLQNTFVRNVYILPLQH